MESPLTDILSILLTVFWLYFFQIIFPKSSHIILLSSSLLFPLVSLLFGLPSISPGLSGLHLSEDLFTLFPVIIFPMPWDIWNLSLLNGSRCLFFFGFSCLKNPVFSLPSDQ